MLTMSAGETSPFSFAARKAKSISRSIEGAFSIALSVPRRRVTPLDSISGMSGSLPKKAFDLGQTTIGTFASAHLSRSLSVAAIM